LDPGPDNPVRSLPKAKDGTEEDRGTGGGNPVPLVVPRYYEIAVLSAG
jgi:hypothetical protein